VHLDDKAIKCLQTLNDRIKPDLLPQEFIPIYKLIYNQWNSFSFEAQVVVAIHAHALGLNKTFFDSLVKIFFA
jgi:hypothetical protein